MVCLDKIETLNRTKVWKRDFHSYGAKRAFYVELEQNTRRASLPLVTKGGV